MNNNKVFYWSIAGALAGFLFGFDTIVINGAEQELQKLWSGYTLNGRNDLFHGIVVVGSALWGTVIGAMFGGFPNDKIGRKKTLFLIGVLYTVSALGSALVSDPWLFAAFRFIGGLGVGASTIAAPTFVSEIAPANQRGRLVALYQLNIVFGILVAFISNYLIAKSIEIESWRWMIGIEALPALLYTLIVLTVPESPRWLLLKQGNVEKARKIFEKIYHSTQVQAQLEQVRTSSPQTRGSSEKLFSAKYKRPLLLAFAIAFFNQFSGINALLYYAKRIFSEAGLGEDAVFLSTVGVGIANFIFTIIGVIIIDKVGRKRLMYIGSFGYIITLTTTSLAFFFGWASIVPPALFLFIGAHAIGQGAVIWVFISEIFPNHMRSKGQSFGSSVHWWLAAIIPAMVPVLFTTIGAGWVFAAFAILMAFQLIFVWKVMPETKGKTLEQLETEML
ncbi:sugar porter family MFS transporter [Roseivirga thermotolerans]|uniref:MFS transporter n=1 Tax=Roseivirga thermotolerans TaxID=1758176 RepID=A0ABQ3IAW2_9BACT|nr:sugar porter family MFS transporter [Roseivirga thermotolerans]GHE70828.1 MFS transporter [Roseivirga thermotolerans]